MNAKQLRIVAVVLGLAVLLYLPRVFRDDGAGGSVDVGEGFSLVVADEITGVDIVQAEDADTIRLERTPEGWTVDGYVADEQKIVDLLDVLANLSSDELVARNPSNHEAMGVADDGRRIEVHTSGGEAAGFHLGERDLRAGGYFARLPGQPAVYRLDSPAGGYLSRERDGWRPRQIASVDTAAVREIVVRRDDREAVVRRADDVWLVADAPADSAAVQGLLAMLPTLSVSGFPTEEEEAAADFSLADGSLDVFSADQRDVTGRRLELSLRLISDEERGDWLVRRADGAEVYRLAGFSVNRLLPEALIP